MAWAYLKILAVCAKCAPVVFLGEDIVLEKVSAGINKIFTLMVVKLKGPLFATTPQPPPVERLPINDKILRLDSSEERRTSGRECRFLRREEGETPQRRNA
ncbi:hypothetical protein TNCV_1941511 [Trichonephila clavipes]|uniref:Uncharacterized protein n=1 Tax=Trichonephila clavipes TaxID=2585209 RepID=A0A8X6SA54_TRICX|nr:hypothetical protein TNCV_1941511 [Trichonephila clavipes]